MNPHLRTFVAACLLSGASLAPAARAQFHSPVAGEGDYETPPTLVADDILKPEFLSGPHFNVLPNVPTAAGRNQYMIESDFGRFDADGNAELVERIQEIVAIAKLREVSRTDEYKKALAKAATSPIKLAKNVVTDPVKTVSSVPKGIWKFLNRTGQSIKEAGEKRERGPYDDKPAEDIIGFSKAKRGLAIELGVDPYSSNQVLQKELDGIAWASFAGSMTIKLALAPVGGGAGTAITGVGIAQGASESLRDMSPSDLRRAGLGKLLEMDVPREDAAAFLNNPAYSPTNQTLLVDALAKLHGASGRVEFIRLAKDVTDEADALFFRKSAEVMALVQRETPIDVVSAFQGFPVCLTKDGAVVVPIEWDYACWTENAANFVRTIKSGNFGSAKISSYRVVLTGVVSSKGKDELLANGFTLTEKALPGPLK